MLSLTDCVGKYRMQYSASDTHSRLQGTLEVDQPPQTTMIKLPLQRQGIQQPMLDPIRNTDRSEAHCEVTRPAIVMSVAFESRLLSSKNKDVE